MRHLYYQFFKAPRDIIVNVNGTRHAKNCLLLYITAPFKAKSPSHGHQNQWQAIKLAEILGEFGYNVDVINFNNTRVKLPRQYDMVIDLHPGMNDRYKAHMAPGCRRIAYITGSNPAFSNQAEQARLDAIYRRRGVRLKARRHVQPFPKAELESFDAFFFIGNAHNLKTYAEFEVPLPCLIRNTGYSFLAPVSTRQPSARHFLYFASLGQVHKGLDLLLEVFARHPELHLHVCGMYEKERDFCAAYRRELFETPNVHPHGFVDIDAPAFRAIADQCAYMVMPSCSEGMAGSVLTAMSAGLIPIVSRECGLEEDEVFHFDTCNMEAIERTVVELAAREPDWVAVQSQRMLAIVNERYSEEAFAASIRQGLNRVLGQA